MTSQRFSRLQELLKDKWFQRYGDQSRIDTHISDRSPFSPDGKTNFAHIP